MTDTPATAGLTLTQGALRLALRPDLGGSIAGLWRDGLPVLRSTKAGDLNEPRASACYPLVPYSNRLGWRRFRWAGHDHTTAANVDDSPHSLHGTAWQRAWSVVESGESSALLRLDHAADAHWPFAFRVQQQFELEAQALTVRLAFTNTDAATQPVGLGWHPYFPKRERTRLHIELSDRWESDATQLPTRKVAQPGIDGDVVHMDYDHCFDGWPGAARLRDERLSLRLTSDLSRLVVYTPTTKPYYCVEPVSHVSNAIHMADPLAHGLRALAPGETMTAWMRLEVAST
jgi:aldose 1-epimerase